MPLPVLGEKAQFLDIQKWIKLLKKWMSPWRVLLPQHRQLRWPRIPGLFEEPHRKTRAARSHLKWQKLVADAESPLDVKYLTTIHNLTASISNCFP